MKKILNINVFNARLVFQKKLILSNIIVICMKNKDLISVILRDAKKKKDFINKQILLSIFRKCIQIISMIYT